MLNTTNPLTRRARAGSVWLLVSAVLLIVLAGCAAAQSTPPGSAELAEVQARLQRLEDSEAIRDTQFCYGNAQDVVYRNYADEARAEREGLAAFQECFTDDANITITFFGGEPLEASGSLTEWIDFVWNFSQTEGYGSTRHLLSNLAVEFTGPDSAVVRSAGTTPHFIRGSETEEQPAVDWITGNYRGDVVRTADGWKLTTFQINGEEALRSPGFYPFGQSDGSGNLGF